MRILKWGLIAIACFLGGAGLQAVADYAVTQGSGTTFFAFTSGGKQVPAHVVVNSSSTEVGTAAVPFQVTGANGTFPISGSATVSGTVTANQGTANATPWLVTGTGGTFPVSGTLAATQSGTWTMQPGNTPNTTPWLQIIRDAAGNARGANVNASSQLSVSCDNGCSASTSITSWGGGTLGAMANYGTSPGAVLVPGVNAFITNANANGQATMANSSPVTIASNQTANALWGHGATAASVPANATMAGARAQNAEATAVTNGQLAALATDLVGKLIMLPYANPENFVQGVTASITDTTTTSIIASAGGSLRNYLTSCKVTNSHATVGTYVNILDGTTVIDSGFAAPVGGGWVSTYGAPLKGTAATAVNCKAETTGASFKCQCNGYKGL